MIINIQIFLKKKKYLNFSIISLITPITFFCIQMFYHLVATTPMFVFFFVCVMYDNTEYKFCTIMMTDFILEHTKQIYKKYTS